MVEDPSGAVGQDERLCDALAACLESAERGGPDGVEEVIARYPEYRAEIREFLETGDRLAGLTAPVRWVSQTLRDEVRAEPAHGGADTRPGTSGVRFVGELELQDEIGRGGMGVVYRARHPALKRTVALKMVRSSLLGDAKALRRFCHEAETVASLDHPNIVPIYDIGEANGNLFFSMKLLEGGSLKDRLADFRDDPEAAVRLVSVVARAIDHAHRRGVLHRDLKPSNVLLDAAGQPHVADFGLAKWVGSDSEPATPEPPPLPDLASDSDLKQSGALLGTPSYMAPEQASPNPRPCPGAGPGPGQGPNTQVTTATDVYGLGAVLYALLTGGPPFSGPSMMLVLDRVCKQPPEPPRSRNPRVDLDLQAVCLRTMEKDPARRYGSAAELADELDRWLAGLPVRANPASGPRRLWKWCRRHPALSSLATAAALLLALLLTTLSVAVVFVRQERDRALAQQARAEAREGEIVNQLYAVDMGLAHRAWLRGDVNGMGRLLDQWRPAAGGEDLRDTAWRLLDPLRSPDPLAPPRVERAHRGDVYGLTFSPDGKVMASAGKDGVVRLRRRGGGTQVLRGHRGEVNSVAFDRGGKRLATAGDDGTARVWEAVTGQPLHVFRGHDGEVVAAEFTPDGKILVTTGRDGTLRRWRLSPGEPFPPVQAATDRVAGLAIAPDGRTAATAGKDGFLRAWDLTTGRQCFQHQMVGPCDCVAYAPDGSVLAGADSTGHLWTLATASGEPLRMLTCDNGCALEGVAFSPDGRTLAACGRNGRVRVWDLHRGVLRRNLDCEELRFWCMAFTPDGNSLACGASDGSVRTWDLSAAYAARFLAPSAANRCCSVSYSPDGKTLAVAGYDGSVSFWDPRSLRERVEIPRLAAAGPGRQLVEFERSGSALVVCAADGSLERWLPDVHRRSGRLTGPGRRPLSLCCRPGAAEWLACVDGSTPVCWDGVSGRSVPRDLGDKPCTAAAWSPDGKALAVSTAGWVRLLRDGGEEITRLKLDRQSFGSPALAFSPDGSILAAVDYGGVIRLWETAGWRSGPCLQGRQLAVQSLAFSPCGKVLAGGGEDGTVKIWSVTSGRELFTLTSRLGGRVFQVAFAPDGGSLAAACANYDGTSDVALWPASP